MIVARGTIMQYQGGPRTTVIPFHGIPAGEFSTDTVEQQIMDFLDGKTHGEDLLHRLYDYVLDEPIPDRLRSQLQE